MTYYLKPRHERWQYIDNDGKVTDSRGDAQRFRSEDEAKRFQKMYLDDPYGVEIKEE